MLNSLLIRNFRLFKEIKIPKLNRINLFVGKNNSGKSCLLEAIQVFAAKAMPTTLSELVLTRDEYWEQLISQYEEPFGQEFEDPLRHIFYGYHFPEVDSDGIEIGPIGKAQKRIHIHPRAYIITEEEDGTRRRTFIDKEEITNELVNIHTGLVLMEGNKILYLMELPYSARDSRIYKKRIYDIFKEKVNNVQVVPTQNMPINKVSSLWDSINLTDLQDDVVSGLKIIEPNIMGIALVGDTNSRDSRRIPIVRCEGTEERIPLKTMGDGLTRLFHIILALINARDGFLLIDEFENGLHWSIHSKVWKTIFEISEKLNVQVFATTHSQDCVRGFYTVWSGKESDATFYRLEVDSRLGAKAINYSSGILSDALESDVEVR